MIIITEILSVIIECIFYGNIFMGNIGIYFSIFMNAQFYKYHVLVFFVDLLIKYFFLLKIYFFSSIMLALYLNLFYHNQNYYFVHEYSCNRFSLIITYIFWLFNFLTMYFKVLSFHIPSYFHLCHRNYRRLCFTSDF